MKVKIFFIVLFFVLLNVDSFSQDFGFGFDDAETSANNSLNVTVSGEASASMIGYVYDFKEGTDHVQLGDIFSGKLNFSARTSIGEGVINLNIEPSSSPVSIDEAYARAFLGNFDITAGLRKLTWGKADSMGPLDVINPLDTSRIYTTLADQNGLMSVKIARPMVHASYRFGQFSKIEGVFMPNFAPHNIPRDGKWSPAQMRMMDNVNINMSGLLPSLPGMIASLPPEIIASIPPELLLSLPGIIASLPAEINLPLSSVITEEQTDSLNFFQAGLRYTTTIGSADVGLQYFYGRLPQPSLKIDYPDLLSLLLLISDPSFDPSMLLTSGILDEFDVSIIYNTYHQIGIDYAQVLFGFNVRSEVAINITEDFDGNDGSIYNPALLWSLGFDRDLFAGINLNLQANQSIILMHDKLGNSIGSLQEKIMENPMSLFLEEFNPDIEGGNPPTSTRITASLSRKFFRDELELRTAFVFGIEDKDFLIMPALIWTKDDLRFALSGGIFAGDEEGQLGQYWRNNFVKVAMGYSF